MSSVTIPPDDLLEWDESRLIEALSSIKNVPKGRSALGELITSKLIKARRSLELSYNGKLLKSIWRLTKHFLCKPFFAFMVE